MKSLIGSLVAMAALAALAACSPDQSAKSPTLTEPPKPTLSTAGRPRVSRADVEKFQSASIVETIPVTGKSSNGKCDLEQVVMQGIADAQKNHRRPDGIIDKSISFKADSGGACSGNIVVQRVGNPIDTKQLQWRVFKGTDLKSFSGQKPVNIPDEESPSGGGVVEEGAGAADVPVGG